MDWLGKGKTNIGVIWKYWYKILIITTVWKWLNINQGEEIYKFKIEASNGNSYSELTISILNGNGLHIIFTKNDIPGYKHVNYSQDNTIRLNISKSNISAAEDLIKKVFK